MAEGKLAEALDAARIAYKLDPGGGAFYAPKIDVFIEDALGREWQMATIQLDYQLPQRFELEYRSADGGVERPVVIHYAIYGSFERFIGILVEHYAGAFPLWLAPVQAVVIPIADRHVEAGRRAGQRPCVRAGCASRSTTRTTGCSTRSGRPRSRRSRTCSSSVTARSRHEPLRRRTRAGEQLPAEGWEALADRLAQEAAERRP